MIVAMTMMMIVSVTVVTENIIMFTITIYFKLYYFHSLTMEVSTNLNSN